MLSWKGVPGVIREPLGPPGPRRLWRAEANGRPAVAIEQQMGSPQEAKLVGQRLARLQAHADDRLRPVKGWAIAGERVWVLSDPDAGPSLTDLLAAGPVAPAEAAAIGWWVLRGLEALHEVSLAHGALAPENVHLDATGRVRLDGHLFDPRVSASPADMAADVEAAGALGCSAMGIAVHQQPGAAPARAETEAPALARTLRAIASGASGANVIGARMALAAAAGPLVDADGLAAAADSLAGRAGRPPGARMGGAAAGPGTAPRPAPPPLPPRRYVATAADLEEVREPAGWRRFALPLVALAILLAVAAASWIGVSALVGRGSRPGPAISGQPPAAAAPAAPPTAAATPTPRPTPFSFGPASAGDVKSVEMTLAGCSPGGQCSADVTVHTTLAGSPGDVTWTVRAYDPCTGSVTDVGQGKVTEQAGWNTIEGSSSLVLPAARGQLVLAAVTTAPASAASPVATVGQGGC